MVGGLCTLWTDSCEIAEFRSFKKPNGASSHREEVVLTNVPCRVSYKRSPALSDGIQPILSQNVKLFLNKNVVVKPGSKITVNRDGVLTEYRQSGKAMVYSSHQEIELCLFDGWG